MVHKLPSLRYLQRMLAGLPKELIVGAIQQAPQPSLHSISYCLPLLNRLSAGLPLGIPGIADVILGATQHAPQPKRHSIKLNSLNSRGRDSSKK